MAQLGTTFNASTVAPAEASLPVWEGIVPGTIVKTEVKDTSANDGNKMLVLTIRAAMGRYAGTENVVRLNLWNKNATAVDIAQRTLSSICHVTGKMQISDSNELIGAPFLSVWERKDRQVADQTTGQTRTVEGCECKDYRLADGRSIKEMLAGQPASVPFDPAAASAPAPQHTPAAPAQHAPPTAPSAPQEAPGFQPPAGAPGHAAPQTATGGFAPAGGFAPTAPAGGMPPAAGTGTAASPSNGGFAMPAAAPAGGGFGQQAPGGAPAGFGAPGGAAPAGFGAPQAPGPQGGGFAAPNGAGPWGQLR